MADRWAIVAVCASGPSMVSAAPWVVKAAERGLLVIVTNDTWRLLPKADLLFAANARWWQIANPRVAPTLDEFKGERIVSEPIRISNVSYVVPRPVGWSGGNSALRACHLAEDRGAKMILLFGVDLHDGEPTHWHGSHPSGLANPKPGTFARQRRAWAQWAKEPPRALVINCNPRSALDCFIKREPEEALEALCGVTC